MKSVINIVVLAVSTTLSLTACRGGIEGEGTNSGNPKLSAPSSDNSAGSAVNPPNIINSSFVDSSVSNADSSHADTLQRKIDLLKEILYRFDGMIL